MDAVPSFAAPDLAAAVSAAAATAEATDRDSLFPQAALAALRDAGLLSALVPRAFGGAGLAPSAVAAQCHALGAACASTAMIFAMHQAQVACLVAHAGASPWQDDLLRRVARDGLLVASVTSEVGVGGEFRNSHCALQWDANRFTLDKTTPIISYGAHADLLLATARHDPAANGTAQVMVALDRADFTLERRGAWNGMGLRGTDSAPFRVLAAGGAAQVLRDGFPLIATQTLLPISHLFWAGLWLGIAADAVGRTRRFLKRERQRTGTLPIGALRLVDAVALLRTLRERTAAMLSRYDTQFATGGFGTRMSDTADANLLKLSVSEGCIAAVQSCLAACGFQGYSNAGPFSLTRHLRDLQAGPLMVNNDRIRENTAALLLAQLPELGF